MKKRSKQFIGTSLPLFRKRLILLVTLLAIGFMSAFAQKVTVKGKVTDETKEGLVGVSVTIKGTTNGTLTDIDGNYILPANVGDQLAFTYVGMKNQTVTVSSSTLNVTMKSDEHVLNEVVAIGYGVSKKQDLTGSIASVNANDIARQPALSPVQSIQGKVSGVNIVNSDEPGSSPTILIRGMGTALSGRNPLYIVDGFPVDDINNISASDIVSMDILKDASSASIYGLRAANGVIIITTKKGQAGSAKVSIDSYFGLKSMANRVKMANASQYIEYFNEKQVSTGGSWTLADASEQSYNTDWYSELLKTGMFNNNTVSVSGGTDKVNYFASYNYYKEDGILSDQDYQRSTIRNNNTYSLFNDRLTLKQNINLSFSGAHPKPLGAFNEAYRQSPLVPVKYANGRYGMPFVNTTTGVVTYEAADGETVGSLNSIGNPMFTVDNYNEYDKTLTLQGGFDAEFKINSFLKFNSRIGATKYYSRNRIFTDIENAWLNTDPTRTESDFETLQSDNEGTTTYADNSLRFDVEETFRWTWENFLSFNKSFGKHNLDAVLGTSREKFGVGYYNTMTGYEVPEKSQYWSLSHVSGDYDNIVDEYSYTPTALASYFLRAQYNYDNKYYFSGTIRRDGSSIFKESGDYWGVFPSFGFGWTISKENFMSSTKWVDYLKLKANWGKLGNQNVPLNVSEILTATGSSSYNYVFGTDQDLVYGAVYGTPAVGLSWEITREWGIGADFSLLDNRLSGSIDYYDKTNTNAILEVTPTLNSEYEENYYDHGAKISNTGVELNLAWKDQINRNLSYEIGFNYSHNKNTVKQVKSAYDGATGGSLSNGEVTKKLLEGQPLYAWWMFETDGVWQNEDEIASNPYYGSPKPGYLRYKDQNDDDVIDDRDKVFFGSYLPTYNYGVHLGLNYKKMDFSVDGYGVGGNKVYNALKGTRIDGGENIAYDTYKNRWTGENSTNTNPGADRDSYASNYYLESGAFFRINNITLGYSFDDLVVRGTSLRLYFTAQNPLIVTGYSGFSPEITTSTGAPNGTTGIELSAYPTTRNFLMGVNLKF
jgi:TonB-dependent starch-binding outer membrane protein SusC